MEESTNMVTRATELLRKSPVVRSLGLVVSGSDTSIVLTGKVASFYQKQMAQETLRPLFSEGVKLENRITVE